MIPWKWLKARENESLPYKEILLDENDIKHIKKIPESVFNKLFDITKAEIWMKVLEGKITLEQAKGAISFAKYLKGYFK